jgi:DNA protecting protein DprA
VAVVGGRRASPLRRAAARSLGAGLARAGWCVVSGGAVGVDAAAHAGALDAGGRTVVVLGCGLDVPYPRANTGLFARVRAAGGTLASEHPPGTPPRAAHFLPRNRLIAALAAAVVVVEAAEDSGSLSTARAAGSRGLGHVLVLPGAPWDPGAAGCNQLIRDGATLVRSLTDILEELGTTATCAGTYGAGTCGVGSCGAGSCGVGSCGATATYGATAAVPAWSGLDPPARAVLTALIDGQLLSPGRLAAATDLAPTALEGALLDLELAGLVRRSAAGVQAIGLPRRRPATLAEPAPPAQPPDGAGGRSPDAVGVGAEGPPQAGTGATGRAVAFPGPRGPPPPGPSAEVLECGGSGGDDGRDD